MEGVEEPAAWAREERRRHSYAVSVAWTGNLGTGTSGYTAYSRNHEITAEGRPPLACSSDPSFRGDPSRYSPEELLVASLSSCHMLWYLHLCADSGIVVTDYHDSARGMMVETADGGGHFVAPAVRIADGGDPDLALRLHERAHQLCFIANSVNFPVRCEPRVAVG
jgi:organic hydroperoxide reductase OsmC/OhrA